MIDFYHTKLLDCHKGTSAFVVGAGTSLYGLDLGPIHKHVVIAINSAIMLMPWEDGSSDCRYWISNDALCRKWSWWKDVINSRATKIVRDSWKKYFDELSSHDFYQFSPRKTKEDIIEDDDLGLCYCSSVPSGIDLAIKMGCKNIFLLGVDQYVIPPRKSHYWQLWPLEKQPKRIDGAMASISQQQWTFAYNDRAYYALQDYAQRKNVSIFNCSMDSRVNVFKKISFHDSIKMVTT